MKLDLFEFEAVPDDGGSGGGDAPEPVEPAPAPDEGQPSGEPEVPAAASVDWNNLPPEAEARLAGMSQQQALAVLEGLGLVSYDQPQQAGPAAPDPLADDYPQQLEAWYAAKQAQTNAPIQQWIEQQQAAQVDGQIGETIDKTLAALDIAKPEDPAQAQAFTGVVRAVAESFTGQAVQQFGATPRAAEEAVKMAVNYLAADRKTAGEAAVAAYIASLNGDGRPREPGVLGAAIPAAGAPQSEAEVARMWRDRVPA